MKSPAFDYLRAESPQQVYQLLARHGDDMRVLAGGQTLLATLNMRLSSPALLVDLGGLNELRGISVQNAAQGPVLRIGAMTRHVDIEESPLVAQHAPLLTQAAPHIAHRAIRNLGTLGGALAYADPAAEWPACVLALDGTLVLGSAQGERRVAASDFFRGLYSTALLSEELLLACELPLLQAHEQQVFGELARRQGDYALAGLAARAQWRDGLLQQLRLVFFSLGDRPLRAPAAEAVLQSAPLTPALVDEADRALRAELNPYADLTHSPAAKTQFAATLMRRAVARLARA
jgi:aerobic carbon-monoxide dehydrogenase medium subunit